MNEEPKCFRCGKKPNEIDEYVLCAQDNNMSAVDYVREEEGTYNPKTNTFCCTDCYVEIGMPSNADGWEAPAPLRD